MRRSFAVVLTVLVAACSSNPRPTPAPPPPVPVAAPNLTVPARTPCVPACTAVERTAREIDALLGAPSLRQAIWTVQVQSLDSGEVLYSLNPYTLVVPASNTKIVTMAVAAERLGWDYRFETRLETAAPIGNGTLQGDLVVVGRGDPSINGRLGDTSAVFTEFADALRQAGVTRIDGRIIGDDDAFVEEPYGLGWAWDNFAFGYAAPVGALQFNENQVEVVVAPGPSVGAPAVVTIRQDGSGLQIVNLATTAAADTKADVDIFRFPGRVELEVRGTVPLGGTEVVENAAVENPTLFFARTLKAALQARGIEVSGDAVDVDDLPQDARGAGDTKGAGQAPRVLLRHLSPPLSDIARRLMKVSQNLYAETFLRALSLTPGPATVAESQKVEDEVLASWGVAPGNYALADGSGLSRHNLVSADTIVKILRAMATSPKHAQAFEATLPIAGKDGTISGRMKATRAENNVKAKTGTLTRVRALSGYMTTADGERLVFSIIANHFTVPTRAVDTAVDAALERLANFTRRAM
jgi:D-alanyl-D-alanine carboxypeptidase/D-alanyl-D-alanine-endopeptidase (penicillin-binding protein 4)